MAINGSYLPAGNGNINGAALNSVFLTTGSDDAKWQLKPGSPALGAGAGGVNLGAFGGVAPYILSGVPGIPRITRMVVPPVVTTGSGFTFEVDAKSFGN